MQTLREHQLYAKLSKRDFYKIEVQYLGHVISEEGVAVDPAKIKATLEWPVPKYVHDIIYFIGLTCYYHIFIEMFSRISHPITTLENKSI